MLQTNIAMNDMYDTRLCYNNSLVSYRPFTAMLVWSVFFPIFPKCLFVIIVIYAYFIDISQGSAETHLRCGGIYNNHIIANCLQSVPVKEFWKSVNKWQRLDKVKWHIFGAHPVLAPTCISLCAYVKHDNHAHI